MTLPDTAVLSLFDRNGNAKDVYVPLISRYTWEQSFNCSSFLEDVNKLGHSERQQCTYASFENHGWPKT
jgi:hypothetical protein